MNKRTRNIILLIVGLQFVLIIGFLTLPQVVQAIPGRYRVALQERIPVASTVLEEVIDQVAPVATALPAANQPGNTAEVDIAALVARSTAVPSNEPTPSPEPTQEAVVVEESEGVAEVEATTTSASLSTDVPTNIPPPPPTQTPTPEPLPINHVLEGMGVIKQTFNNCGPANLTQVLNWYGNDITQEEIAAYLKPSSEDRNVSPWQIADYVNEQTSGVYMAVAHSGGKQELIKELIVAGYPVVIEKGYELPESGWWGHYLTVYGYDDNLGQFYTQDSYLGPWDGSGRPATYTEVEQYWPQFNNTFYVVFKPEQEAEVKAIIGPELSDKIRMWQLVAEHTQAQVEANPDDVFAWFNLGTALTRLGENVLEGNAKYYEAAAQAFDQAREIGLPPRMLWYQHRPYIAYDKVGRYQDVIDLANATLATQGGRNVEETYWYKGHALAALGDLYGAQDAYQSALAVNENFYPAQISLDWVNTVINGN
ncbi:MAG: hypothetical protein GY796_14475 [Chloroflexi bacterium]|nr:hypothetical protein [Chloroflexota bacterium]